MNVLYIEIRGECDKEMRGHVKSERTQGHVTSKKNKRCRVMEKISDGIKSD